MTNDATTVLTATDRCDRCGAQAYVRVEIGQHDLLFCGHHYTANELPLMSVSSNVHDERAQLNESEQRKTALA